MAAWSNVVAMSQKISYFDLLLSLHGSFICMHLGSQRASWDLISAMHGRTGSTFILRAEKAQTQT
jgi:hypothetical protein